MCEQRDDEVLNAFPHNEQANGFSFAWTLICLTKSEFWLKDFVQGDTWKASRHSANLAFRICLNSCWHNCLLVLQVAGVFWVAKKVSIFNSSILPSYFSSCSSLSATQDCWFNQFPGQQYFAQWELQLMILFWMNMNLFKRKQYIVFCIEKKHSKTWPYLHIYIKCYNSRYAKDYLFVHIEGLDTLMRANECLYFCSIGF